VLDQEDSDALSFREIGNDPTKELGLVLVETGRWLVEEEEQKVGDHGPGQLDEALLAGRQRASQLCMQGNDATALHGLIGACEEVAAFAPPGDELSERVAARPAGL
jgi:hypothetical protein